MTDQWPEDGSQPWIHADPERDRLTLEWADHLFTLDRVTGWRLVNRLADELHGLEVERIRRRSQERDR